ncbi:MAG: tRNA (N6-isopentenyl adenosine(37)-C2)-methylthiotransferase MiaB [Candidatus Marinimicrobia bacterium]|nr:tRNA (N6-isopentenyl adenosine(37)-C2)-methylthiotransferase MiaB [Candidatus Neomarinimicrobiota bacterium]MBL6826782.1 tRNA (N6-isopentenyl adenosine(37)-C2)-methylthiotransferase MiaB [Candidatus Neomarinimicrobiota bacterium]MDA0753566.1 tRNA (N6-isopentenyl adenosine(37)-C2)-methylthiotransferase MiaB [Candidatus Neomarinimicrobiota bacterium]MDA1363443.1 tRNA (N6-isopentenyl adenosine(37)-C2)-methylthiotransferase MiaB [Candidatus Neomarinimicrobiota bacterium]
MDSSIIKKFALETYGCQMNVADSELVEGILTNLGLEKTANYDEADAIFLNTCAIRENAETKVHSKLGNLHKIKLNKPHLIIGVLGCMAQNLKDDLLKNKPYVDIILGPDSYRKIPDLINRHVKDNKSIVDTKLSRYEVYENLFPSRGDTFNAWVSIMRGCDKFCSFCIVPFTRGRERSRSVESVVEEVKKAVDQGFVEITLLGQNVNSYNFEGKSFSDLLLAVSDINGVKRIRYTSPHPQDINIELLEVMASRKNICNYVHFPMQSGSNEVLKRMNRTYTREHFYDMAMKIREIMPNCGLSTDIIVGFPGETDEQFRETLDLMEAIKFNSAFTFKYSPRPYTKAEQFSDHISEEIKKSRLDEMLILQRKHTLELNQNMVGTFQQVLIEKESKKSNLHWAGRTDSNEWVIIEKNNSNIKDIVPVEISDATGVILHGKEITGA